MGGLFNKGSKAPAAPDYTPIAAANEEAARIQSQIAREQLQWAKDVYATDKQMTDKVTERLLGILGDESAAAKADRERYKSVFQPLEDRMISDAIEDRDRYEKTIRPLEDQYIQDSQAARDRYQRDTVPLEEAMAKDAAEYNTVARQEAEAGRDAATVARAFEGARRGALATLESYGVDPSQTRAGALDLGVRTAGAAAQAGAANNARREVEDKGRLLRMDAINVGRQTGVGAIPSALATTANNQGAISNAVNVGRGYPGQVASAYGTAQGAGQGAIQSNLATTASGANTMGTGVQWQGGANNILSSWGNQVASMNNAATQAAAQRSQGNSAGALLGGIAGIALSPSSGFSNTLLGSLFR